MIVILHALLERTRGVYDRLELFPEPLPFVAEVWSPSTDGYDTEAKLPEYRRRGDREIWFVHPRARLLRVWRW